MITPFIRRLSTTSVSTHLGTKQILYTVPPNRNAVITHIVVRNAGATLAGLSGNIQFGFDSNAGDWNNAFALTSLTTLLLSLLKAATSASVIGAAADTFGCKFLDATSTNTTVTIDVFGYLY